MCPINFKIKACNDSKANGFVSKNISIGRANFIGAMASLRAHPYDPRNDYLDVMIDLSIFFWDRFIISTPTPSLFFYEWEQDFKGMISEIFGISCMAMLIEKDLKIDFNDILPYPIIGKKVRPDLIYYHNHSTTTIASVFECKGASSTSSASNQFGDAKVKIQKIKNRMPNVEAYASCTLIPIFRGSKPYIKVQSFKTGKIKVKSPILVNSEEKFLKEYQKIKIARSVGLHKLADYLIINYNQNIFVNYHPTVPFDNLSNKNGYYSLARDEILNKPDLPMENNTLGIIGRSHYLFRNGYVNEQNKIMINIGIKRKHALLMLEDDFREQQSTRENMQSDTFASLSNGIHVTIFDELER